MNFILLQGAILGFLSVIIAAYFDHSALYLTFKQLSSVLTAVRYHQLYSIVICGIGLALPLQKNNRIKSWLNTSAHIFYVGIILFSFSIYISAFFNLPQILYLTPVGGILLMVGWISLIRTAMLK